MEKIEIKDALYQLHKALHNLDEHVIGLAKIHGSTELVIEKGKDIVITYRMGALLGSQTSHYQIDKFESCIFMFPNGMSLAELKKDPFALNDFCEKHKI